jgi:hypothetical protein
MRFHTFNQVVTCYESTKPVLSKHHNTEDDIRPIGARRRKWERIRKVDENTYCLLDGNYTHSMWKNKNPDALGYERDMAPIMWKREADGDYIYVRNCTKQACSWSRMKFLQWYLPMNAVFRYDRQGKHWVRAETPEGWKDFPLPKTSYTWDYHKNQSLTDDGVRLRFKANEDGTFTRMGEPFKAYSTTVDKVTKNGFRESIAAFYTHAATLAPLVDTSWDGRNQYRLIVQDWLKNNGFRNVGYFNLRDMPAAIGRQVVTQDDHPLRIPMIALVVDEIGGKNVTSEEELRSVRAAYNRLMNKFLGLYETKEI